MADQTAGAPRPMGTRYEIDQGDGTWWELGWDEPLGTFYAQHHHPDVADSTDLLAWYGTRPAELDSVAALACRLPVALPAQIADELQRDADAHPHTVDPPGLALAEALVGASPGWIRARAQERPPGPQAPFVRPCVGETNLPPGWTVADAGLWEGTPSEVVFDPARHDVLFVRGQPTSPTLDEALPAAGWAPADSDGRSQMWVRDKAAWAAATARVGLDRVETAPLPPGRDRSLAR